MAFQCLIHGSECSACFSCNEDRIAALKAENERLRGALEEIRDMDFDPDSGYAPYGMQDIAQEALSGGRKGVENG